MKLSSSIQPAFWVAVVATIGVMWACLFGILLTMPTAPPSSPVTPVQVIAAAATETDLPVPTAILVLSKTGTPTPTRGILATPTLGTAMLRVKVFLVARGDAGKSGKPIGCGDSIVAVERAIPRTSAVLTAALRELVSLHELTHRDSKLYNALYQSGLKVNTVSIVEGKTTGTDDAGGSLGPRGASGRQ